MSSGASQLAVYRFVINAKRYRSATRIESAAGSAFVTLAYPQAKP